MIDAPRVSVVVPVRDRRDLLRDLLAALDVQTLRDFELIVVDDGSVDGSAELAESTIVAGQPVRVLRQEGLGAVAARQRGAADSRGEVLAFTDSDCTPVPGWLAAGVGSIEAGAAMAPAVYDATRRRRIVGTRRAERARGRRSVDVRLALQLSA